MRDKIYEIRDISDEESYFSKTYFADFETARSMLMETGEDISYDASANDRVVGAIYEHTLGKWENERKVFELTCAKEYDEEKDEYLWLRSITFTS